MKQLVALHQLRCPFSDLTWLVLAKNLDHSLLDVLWHSIDRKSVEGEWRILFELRVMLPLLAMTKARIAFNCPFDLFIHFFLLSLSELLLFQSLGLFHPGGD